MKNTTAAKKNEKKSNMYLMDENGDMVNVKYIDPTEIVKHNKIESIMQRVEKAQNDLITLKKELFNEVRTHLDDIAEEYGEKWKGNAKLYNFSKTKCVEFSINQLLEFDEKLQIAKQKIDKVIETFSEGAREELKTIIKKAFKLDQAKVDVKQVRQLTKYVFDNEDWKEAVLLINQSLTVKGTKEYLNFSKRENPRDQWQSISLNFSTLPVK